MTKINKNTKKYKENLVSLFPNIKVTINPQNLPLLDIIKMISTGEWKKELTEVREIWKACNNRFNKRLKDFEKEVLENPDINLNEAGKKKRLDKIKSDSFKLYKESKNILPYFTASGTFTKRNNKGIDKSNGCIILDIDGLKTEQETALLKQKIIKGCSFAYVVFISPSGRGLKIIVQTNNINATDAKHKKYYKALEQYFINTFSLQLDNSGKDISRPCYVSYDPETYINETAAVYELPKSPTKKTAVKKAKTAVKKDMSSNTEFITNENEIFDRCVKALENKGFYFTDGNKHAFSLELGYICNRYGLPESSTKQLFLNKYGSLSSDTSHHEKNIKDAYSKYLSEYNTHKFESPKKGASKVPPSKKKDNASTKQAGNKSDNLVTEFWKANYNKDGKLRNYEFDYKAFIQFLEQNKFYRYKTKTDNYIYIRIFQDRIVKEVKAIDIREFVRNYIKLKNDDDAWNMIIKGGNRYLAEHILESLSLKEIEFEKAGRDYQYMYFKNECWKVSKNGIEVLQYSKISHYVWQDTLIDFDVTFLKKSLFEINKTGKNFNLDYSVKSKKTQCHFFQYILNASRVFWAKDDKTQEEVNEEITHFVNKVTALGYLQHTYFDDSKRYAVISMDLKTSEVGKANGGTGKSVYGKAAKRTLETMYINGKKKKLFENDFIFQRVTDSTELIFFDDVKTNFEFEQLYVIVTGFLPVNKKNKDEFVIEGDGVPKIYISTNHAINGLDDSDKRRQWFVGFSDYYSPKRQPIDEFGCNFWSEQWPLDQWNMFYNFMAMCIYYYFKLGKVEAPNKEIQQKMLRQQCGNAFLYWADSYFDIDRVPIKLDERLERQQMFDDFRETLTGKDKNYIKPHSFKSKIISYCQIKGFGFNTHKARNGLDIEKRIDKSNSKEFFTISTS